PSSRSRRVRSATASRSAKAFATARATNGRPDTAGTSAYQDDGQGPGAAASTTPITRRRSFGASASSDAVSSTPSAAASGVHGRTSNSSSSSAATDATSD